MAGGAHDCTLRTPFEMGEWRALINEWVSEYAALSESELRSFAAEHEHNHEIATAVYRLLCDDDDATSCSSDADSDAELLEVVCVQLFSFYRSRELELQRFCLQFLPPLVYSYLGLVARGDKRTCRCIETLLIGLHNFEVVDEAGKPKVVSFRLPSLAQASIYHEPLSIAPQFLTESALRRWEECNTKLVSWGPLPQVEALNAQNRLKVMTALFFIYNRQLSLLPKMAFRHFCTAASKIVTQGFATKGKDLSKLCARIPVSSNFLLELVHGAYFAMFNEFYTLALQAVTDIDRRASYELMPEVMLVTGAVINSLQSNPSGQPCDGPMGISVALSPATTTFTVSKSMITNASFRTKKLPDDIPIQAGSVVPTESPDVLASITEEAESDPAAVQRGGALRTSKPKLPAFPGLGKKTNKTPLRQSNGEKKVTLKDARMSSRSSLSGGSDIMDGGSPLPQNKSSELLIEAERNGSIGAGDVSDSLAASLESSDTHSHMTSDSLELEAPPRLAPMQVSSV